MASAGKHQKHQTGLTIGFEASEKINAVEGIQLSHEARDMFAEFDRRGLSPVDRRRAILARYSKKA